MLHQISNLPAEKPTANTMTTAKRHSGVSFMWNNFQLVY